jgi:hypothetical protein
MRTALVEMTLAHLEALSVTPDDAVRFTVIPRPVFFEALKVAGGAAWSRTLLLDGTPLACWGLVQHWQGVAEAWCVPDIRVREHVAFFHRQTRLWLEHQRQALGLWRVQATVDAAQIEARRWATMLGFHMEARLEQYGPAQQDFYLMAMVQLADGTWV